MIPDMSSPPISWHVRTPSLMPPKAGLYQCPTTRCPGSAELRSILPDDLTPALRSRCPPEPCLETLPSPGCVFRHHQSFFATFSRNGSRGFSDQPVRQYHRLKNITSPTCGTAQIDSSVLSAELCGPAAHTNFLSNLSLDQNGAAQPRQMQAESARVLN